MVHVAAEVMRSLDILFFLFHLLGPFVCVTNTKLIPEFNPNLDTQWRVSLTIYMRLETYLANPSLDQALSSFSVLLKPTVSKVYINLS